MASFWKGQNFTALSHLSKWEEPLIWQVGKYQNVAEVGNVGTLKPIGGAAASFWTIRR